MSKGLFIVIEGSDGSGKGTQFKLLAERLKQTGYEVETFDFPRYGKPSAHFVEQYLNGEYGEANAVGPYTSSMFYALDRYAAAPEIHKALDAGKIVISNRFTSSNMAHQGGKLEKREERLGFFTWLDNLEFETLKIPRPDLSIVLKVPAKTAQKLVDRKAKRNYTDKKRDIHEADLGHLEKAIQVYDEMISLFPKNFVGIDCTKNGELLSIPNVNNLIWERIKPLMPKKAKSKQGKPDKSNPYVTKNPNGSFSVTDAGRKYLDKAVTNVDGNVYAFTDKLSNATVAAAMARLSRRGDDMRVTLLDEFAEKEGKDEGLLRRVITAYGDDSVQQLAGLHYVIEGASIWLTKRLEWGRLAAYLEQSTRYIYYDQKDEKGNYKYYTPGHLKASVAKQYEETMNKIFALYSDVVHKTTNYVRHNSNASDGAQDGAWKSATRAQACDAARAMLPMATKSTVGVFASGQALESMIMRLLSDDMAEARETGQALLEEARKVVPVFLERADKPGRGGATIAHRAETRAAMGRIAEKKLTQNLTPAEESIKLNDFWPKNEMDLLPHMLYEHSNLSLEEIESQIAEWTYDEKLKAFQSYFGERLNRRHRPGRALEEAHYNFEIVSEFAVFKDLMRHRMVDDLVWQQWTPRYGYDVPKLIEEAGCSDNFEAAFDLSYKLYSLMQEAGYELEAQYATLHGHRMRWKITYNARQAFHLHELRTSPQGHPNYRRVAHELSKKIGEVHPLIAEQMIFVNKDEDPKLTRLAAERYTQYKLKQLDSTDGKSSRAKPETRKS